MDARRRGSAIAVVLAAGIVAALTGCASAVQDEGYHVPYFERSSEALSTAATVYASYLATKNLIAQDGGEQPGRVAPYSTSDWLEVQVHSANVLSGGGYRQLGTSQVTAFTLRSVAATGDASVEVRVGVCLDETGVRVVDAYQRSNPDLSGQRLTSVLVTLESAESVPSSLVVADESVSRDVDYCT